MKRILLIALLLFSFTVHASIYFSDDNGVAGGNDVVAYFIEGQAIAGSPKFELQWQGATWHFASKAHLEMFSADPEHYAPQFGGAGSLTVAHGARYPGNPAAWSIYNDRLYFFLFPAARETWLMNPDKLVPRAEKQWPDLSNQGD
jgi:YHS domain-containing protein